MSVPNQTPYVIYTANGVTTVFPFEFYIISAADLQVTVNGVEVNTGYTVTGTGNLGGGNVTFLTPPATGATVMLERVVPTTRLTDYQDNGDMLADTVNKDFDRLWMAIQRSFVQLGLALCRPLTGLPFNAEGYRISRLGSPLDRHDAATKSYSDTLHEKGNRYADELNSKTNQHVEALNRATNERVGQLHADISNRALRAPESTISPIPDAATRAGKILSFDEDGAPIAALPPTGTAADVLTELAKSDGATRIGSQQPGGKRETVQQALISKAARGVNSDITHLKGIAAGLSIEKTTATNGVAINITGNDETEVSFGVENVNGGSAVFHNYVKARNGVAAGDGQLIGGYGSRPWTGNNYTEHSNVALHFIQSGSCSNSNHGGYLRIVATPQDSTIDKRVDVASFNGFGDVWIAPSGRYQFTYGNANWRDQEGRGLFIAREGNVAEVQLISAKKNNEVSQGIFRGICHGGTMSDPMATPDGVSTFLVLAGHNGEGFEIAKAGIELRSMGEWSTSSTPACIYFSTCNTTERIRNNRWCITGRGDFVPIGDNAYTVGNQNNRISAIYAANGTIQTSDEREKTKVRGFNKNELAAAKSLAEEIGFYRWIGKYKEEGESAREHCGMTVQRAIEIMVQHQLNPFHYGFICYDCWDEKEVITHYDEFDKPVSEKRASGDRYSFRHDQLALFIVRGLEARIDALESQIKV